MLPNFQNGTKTEQRGKQSSDGRQHLRAQRGNTASKRRTHSGFGTRNTTQESSSSGPPSTSFDTSASAPAKGLPVSTPFRWEATFITDSKSSQISIWAKTLRILSWRTNSVTQFHRPTLVWRISPLMTSHNFLGSLLSQKKSDVIFGYSLSENTWNDNKKQYFLKNLWYKRMSVITLIITPLLTKPSYLFLNWLNCLVWKKL